ncbi:MAG: recombinase family protein [Verrucomicrobiota bacterium]
MNRSIECNKNNACVYSYARWSSDGQGDGDSSRRQDEGAKQWCARRGLNLTGGEQDAGVSAWKGKNRTEGSGLSRLLKIVKTGDFLLVEDNDRLSRQDWLTAMNFLAEIVGKGVTVVTLDNGNEIDAARFRRDPGCFLPAIMRAHLGNDENEKKSERIKASWQARKDKITKGQPANFNLPHWLRWDKETDRPVIVEENAQIIRKMFEWSLAGLGCQTIARKLHSEGFQIVVKGKRGQRVLSITAPTVWRTLRNKLVIGQGIYVQSSPPGVYPAVINEGTFYAVQQRLETNKHQTTRRVTSTASLFTGIAFCSKCGGTLCRYTQCRKSKRYYYLVCSETVHKHGRCGMTGIRYDALEKSFIHLLLETDFVRNKLSEQQPAAPTLCDSLAGQLADAERQAGKLMSLIKSDPDPSPMVYQSMKSEEAKAKELREQLEVEQRRLKAEAPSLALENYDDFCRRFAGRMAQADFRQEIKTLLHGFVLRIVVGLGENRYAVWLNGAKQPIDVYILKNDWVISPSPAWVFGRQVADGGNVIG